MNIYQKLLEIQKHVVGLGKDKSAFNYKYVTGDKVLGEIKPRMNELGLLLKQEVLSITNTRQDYATKNAEKSEIHSCVMMKFTWVDTETGEKDENLFGANGQNDWDKGVGSALTYAERYFLLKYFHIATDEDDIDNPERKPDNSHQQASPKPMAKQKITLAKWKDSTQTETTSHWKNIIDKMMAENPITLSMVEENYTVSPELKKELLQISKK
jgi:hypothetical protein